jgi:uncharacterized metal-binding protein
MPSGKTHLRIELFLLPCALLAFWYWIDPRRESLLVFGGAYLFSALMLSPDLDLRYNRARSHWGVLGFLWIPYTWLFKHRGLSHSLIVGTLTRLLYLGFLSLVAWALLLWWGVELALPTWQMQADYYLLALLAGGLWLPNIVHVLVDRAHRAGRRPRRRYARSG